MDKYSKLIDLLENGAKIKLLFVSANYGDQDKYFEIDVSYFSEEKFTWDVIYIKNENIPEVIEKAKDYDCVVNLCDGYLGNTDDIPNINFIAELEKNKIPYTGSNSRVYCLSKYDLSLVKNTPKSCKVYDGSISFPLFVKANNLGCSEGIDEGSVVHNEEELNNQLEKIYKITNDVIIQEFIEGNEYTALVFRNRAGKIVCLGPMQLKFVNPRVKFLTNELKKSDDYEYEYEFDIENIDKLKEICTSVYEELVLNSYVRMDMRNSLVVDVNPYPEFLGNIEYEEMSDALLNKFYNHNDFMIDLLYEATRKNENVNS